MKKRELEYILKHCGWWFLRSGGNHDIWTNGEKIEPVPRHAEINELTAKSIIKKARKYPPNRREDE